MSIRDQIRNDLDELRESGLRTKEELIRTLADRGYDCKEGKTLSIRGKNQKRFIRLSSLGEGYELRDLLVITAMTFPFAVHPAIHLNRYLSANAKVTPATTLITSNKGFGILISRCFF